MWECRSWTEVFRQTWHLALVAVVANLAAGLALANPNGEQVRSGTVAFDRSGSTLPITQNSNRATID